MAPDSNTNPPVVPVTHRRGDAGVEVQAAQLRLRHLGYTVAVDGVFDAAFEKVLRAFQADNPAFTPNVHGVLDAATWKALRNPFARVLPRAQPALATPCAQRHMVRVFPAFSGGQPA